MKNNASLAYNFILVLGDIMALIVAFMAAFIIRSNSGVDVAHQMQWQTYAVMFASLLPFWILLFALLGLYNSSFYERRFAEMGRLFLGSFIGLLFMVFWDYMSLQAIFPAKLVPIYGFLIGFVLLVMFRNLARLVRTRLFAYGIGLNRVIIIGNTPITLELVNSLTHHHSGYNIVGVIGYRRQLPESVNVYPNFAQFLADNQGELHGIVQTELYANEERNAEILKFAQENHVSYRFVPGNSELFVGNIDVDLFRNSIPVIQVHHTALFGWGRVVKRLTDIVAGSILLVLSAPLWALCALLIKTTDPHGPIFYKARRFSRFGNKISVYKFRTMKQAYNNMSPEAGFAKLGQPELAKTYRKNGDHLPKDPRISRIGRLLRATSLDELPQIWNVIHGEISLVGPRALDIYEMERYDKKNLILSVKSGLTGLAIISGRQGISFEERRKLDLYYVQNWSFWLDVVIVFKTARVILERLVRQGARYK
ncbi:MAG: sugar transferase [Candidatus Saccharimonadales bacterium]